jgi:hypothetical protein
MILKQDILTSLIQKGFISLFVYKSLTLEELANNTELLKSDFSDDVIELVSIKTGNKIVKSFPIIVHMDNMLEKSIDYGGKTAFVGEVRTFADGKDYQKQPDGLWRRHYNREHAANPERLFKDTVSTKYSRVKQLLAKHDGEKNEKVALAILHSNFHENDEHQTQAVINRLIKEKLINGDMKELPAIKQEIAKTIEKPVLELSSDLDKLTAGTNVNVNVLGQKLKGKIHSFSADGKMKILIPSKRIEVAGVNLDQVTHILHENGEEQAVKFGKIPHINQLLDDYQAAQSDDSRDVIAKKIALHPSKFDEGNQVYDKEGTQYTLTELHPLNAPSDSKYVEVVGQGGEVKLMKYEDLRVVDTKYKATFSEAPKSIIDEEEDNDDIKIEGDEDLEVEAKKTGTAQKEEIAPAPIALEDTNVPIFDSENEEDSTVADKLTDALGDVDIQEVNDFKLSPAYSNQEGKELVRAYLGYLLSTGKYMAPPSQTITQESINAYNDVVSGISEADFFKKHKVGDYVSYKLAAESNGNRKILNVAA